MNPFDVIDFFYQDSPLKELLLKHSIQVRDKAMDLIRNANLTDINLEITENGALLHDIGIISCYAPDILCTGTAHYLTHGTAGAEMLRTYGKLNNMDMTPYCLICERHTGAGLAADDVISQNLPLPVKDYLPLTIEEKAVCLADKFFSKSGNMQEKNLHKIRKSMEKFGPDVLKRFNNLCTDFKLPIE